MRASIWARRLATLTWQAKSTADVALHFRLQPATNLENLRLSEPPTDPNCRRSVKGQLLAGGSLLGLLRQDPETWLKTTGKAEIDEAEVERLIELRAAARKAGNFEEADRIRDQLAAEGVILEDQPGRTRWRLAG
jgi:cysteinyl-tRNA synthetase